MSKITHNAVCLAEVTMLDRPGGVQRAAVYHDAYYGRRVQRTEPKWWLLFDYGSRRRVWSTIRQAVAEAWLSDIREAIAG